jgi:hypothetical protein
MEARNLYSNLSSTFILYEGTFVADRDNGMKWIYKSETSRLESYRKQCDKVERKMGLEQEHSDLGLSLHDCVALGKLLFSSKARISKVHHINRILPTL